MFDKIKKRHEVWHKGIWMTNQGIQVYHDRWFLIRMVEGFAEVFEEVGVCDECPVWKSGCNGDCAINILHYINAQARKGVSDD